MTPPAGYTVQTAPPAITIDIGDTAPIENVDAVLNENPSLSGQVTIGAGVPGVTLQLQGPSGPLTTVTDANGEYTFPRLPVGDYVVSITQDDIPAGTYIYTASRSHPVEGDVTDADFALGRYGTVLGAVLDDTGAPVPGVTLDVTSVGESSSVTTGGDGTYSVSDLRTGQHTIAVAAPEGWEIQGPATITVTVTGRRRDLRRSELHSRRRRSRRGGCRGRRRSRG
ncbi:carboxypeptidase-like regulatory domain-containing protein [Microbacterium sp. M28]|uniref:carboxypeptidase-like regulatory domain-containing protein n=1 Tax=Microbacterium sp. M28 TaxID=2962064 RepID=UPI0021F460F2|nr:carboxypeptidase-like regulatory domain-containing protein [Microbacterium sp. M28]UYO97666.1 carboxypeptidase-like regulatory domain-containing protein [Microbacterium sp. M28]